MHAASSDDLPPPTGPLTAMNSPRGMDMLRWVRAGRLESVWWGWSGLCIYMQVKHACEGERERERGRERKKERKKKKKKKKKERERERESVCVCVWVCTVFTAPDFHDRVAFEQTITAELLAASFCMTGKRSSLRRNASTRHTDTQAYQCVCVCQWQVVIFSSFFKTHPKFSIFHSPPQDRSEPTERRSKARLKYWRVTCCKKHNVMFSSKCIITYTHTHTHTPCKDGGGWERVAQQHIRAKTQKGNEHGGRGPEKHAPCVKILSSWTGEWWIIPKESEKRGNDEECIGLTQDLMPHRNPS